jgi:phosphatidate cytidylyltransferase
LLHTLPAQHKKEHAMLRQRIITALLMLAILLPTVFYPSPVPFGVVALVLIAAGAWEWARMNQTSFGAAVAFGGLCAALSATAWWAGWLQTPMRGLWLTVGGGWVLLGMLLLRAGVSAWARVPQSVRLIGGLVALWTAWLAVAQARAMGINFLFSVLVLVWVADIFAYFAGRTWGGKIFARKLAPGISPGKTWEGALGGMLGVIIVAFVWRLADSTLAVDSMSLYSRLWGRGASVMLVAVMFMAAMSVVGDLVESLFKRSAGVKDSSALLPGHGGVLDRVDALLPILPLAMMLSTV